MRAWETRGDGIDALRLVERPVPEPGPSEILVRMRAASLNYRDLLVVNGEGDWKPTAPRIPLSDGVGEVVATGATVSRFQVGDRVAGIFLPRWIDGPLTDEVYVSPLGGAAADGVLAEFRVFDEDSAVAVPDHLTDVEASTLPVAAVTAWHALERSGVQAGESVLIQGTGGVSLFATRFAQALGARPIVISSSDAKLETARTAGAAETINYRQVPDWEPVVRELTGGVGVDHVVEVVGGEHLNRSLEAVRTSGSIAFVGLLAGLSASIGTYRFVTKNVRIHGIETGSRAMFEAMNRFITAHGLRPVVSGTFGFESLADGLHHLAAGGHVGKLAVTIP